SIPTAISHRSTNTLWYSSSYTVTSNVSPLWLSFSFFFYSSAHHRDLHSFPTRRSSDLQDLRAEDAPLGGQERHQDHVVLILAPRRLSLAGEHADHLEGHVLHADARAERILARREELIDDRLPEDRHRIGARVVPLIEEPPCAEAPVAHREVRGRHPLRGRGPVLVAVDDLHHLTLGPRDVADRRALLGDRRRIRHRE